MALGEDIIQAAVDNIKGQKSPEGKQDAGVQGKRSRDTFLYSEPKNPETAANFAECQTCMAYTTKTCLWFTKDFLVEPTDSCNEYVEGEPDPELYGHEIGTLLPKEAGYVKTPVRCENCVSGDAKRLKCTFYEQLNIELPDLFKCDTNIKPKGCCTAQKPKKG